MGTGNEAKNNITSTSTVAEIHVCAGKSNVLSNNLSYSASGAVLKEDNATKTTSYWTSNWDANALYTNPLFFNVSNPPGGFSLQSTSPAKDAGLDLGSTYATDYKGTTRPQGLGWDIGAYEFNPTITNTGTLSGGKWQ